MLIICSECGKEYSDQAKSCPHCGAITSQNRYISNNMRGSYNRNINYPHQNNNMNGTNGSGCGVVLVIIIAVIVGFICLKLLFGFLGKIGLDKDTMKSTFKDMWEEDSFWDGDTSSNLNSSHSTSNKVYNIGDKITTNKFEITVINVEEKSTVGSSYMNESAGEGNTYICCRIKIKNISNEPISTFSQPSFSLVDGKNISYNIDIGASTLYGTEVDDTSKAISDLNPGVTVNDTGVFEIGKGYYSQNSFKLKINADKTILVKVK